MSFDYLGSQATFFPPHNQYGELNIVSGVEAVTARILHLLLTRRGEDPIHPDMGLAPDLFAPFSFSAASALAYQTEQLLIEWNDRASIGIKQLQVTTSSPLSEGNIDVSVVFVPEGDIYPNVLTFGNRSGGERNLVI
jgi:hypothetical protein